MESNTKICTICRLILPNSSFPKGRNQCIKCFATKNAEFRASNKEKKKQTDKKYYEANQERLRQKQTEYHRIKHPIVIEICVICGSNFEKFQYQKCCSKQCSEILAKQTNKNWGLNHPEQLKKNQRRRSLKRRHKHPIRILLSNAKQRAKKKNFEFNLVESDFEIIDTCPILGIKLDWHADKLYDNSATIDRIDNLNGYIKNNSIIVSWRANRIKGDATLEEFKKIVAFIKNRNNTK